MNNQSTNHIARLAGSALLAAVILVGPLAAAEAVTAAQSGTAGAPDGKPVMTLGPMVKEMLADPDVSARKFVFAARPLIQTGHAYETFGTYANGEQGRLKVKGGKLVVLDVLDGTLNTLLDDPAGAVRDVAVDYDGDTILFSYRPGDEVRYHLYTIQADGSGLTQLTRGDYDDVEPCWLPDGDIVFVSGRSQRWVPCFPTEIGNLFRCRRDGSGIRRLTCHVDHDLSPAVLADGRVAFTRWDYIDRNEAGTYHLWAVRPDGTNLSALKLGTGSITVGFEGVKPIDGRYVVAIRSNKQSQRRRGVPVIIDLAQGTEGNAPRDDRPRRENLWRWRGVTDIKGCGDVLPDGGPGREGGVRFLNRDVHPISKRWFLVCGDDGLYLVDHERDRHERLVGNEVLGDNLACHEPDVLAPRQRERIIPDLVDPGSDSAQMLMIDFHAGRSTSIDGIARGEVDRILVLENLPSPIRSYDFPSAWSYGSIWTIKRQLGTFSVEKDGSANVVLPPLRSLQFVALDKEGRALKRMGSAITMMPGEKLTCVGCHEYRDGAPSSSAATLLAARRPPSRLDTEGMPEFIDYLKHIQPIWDRKCISCHNARDMKGHISLTRERGGIYPHSLVYLTGLKHLSYVAARQQNMEVKATGAFNSPLLDMLAKGHHDAKLSDAEQRLLIRWLEIGGTYITTAAADNTGEVNIEKLKHSKAFFDVLERRCLQCHITPEDHKTYYPYNKELTPTFKFIIMLGARNRGMLKEHHAATVGRHPINITASILFNLNRPEDSLLLRAPLAAKSGGLDLCQNSGNGHEPVFQSAADPDYQTLLATIREVREATNVIDFPGFTPNSNYFREMKRYGLLPESFDPAKDHYDLQELEERYYQQQYQLYPAPFNAADPNPSQ